MPALHALKGNSQISLHNYSHQANAHCQSHRPHKLKVSQLQSKYEQLHLNSSAAKLHTITHIIQAFLCVGRRTLLNSLSPPVPARPQLPLQTQPTVKLNEMHSHSSAWLNCSKSSNWLRAAYHIITTVCLLWLSWCFNYHFLTAWNQLIFGFHFIVFVWESPKPQSEATSPFLPLSTKCHRSWFAAEIVVVYHKSQSWLPASEWQACISSL